MKVIILGGFLGSGKTTVILQFARFLVDTAQKRENAVVILENEISENGVDNQLLTKADFTVENMFAGCICCTSSAELGVNVKKIRKEYDPEWLIIEATGMAFPDNIKETLRDEVGIPASVLTLVDVKRWKKISVGMGQFVTAQLSGAAVVMITKVDKVTAEAAEEVAAAVREIAPQAEIVPICALENHTAAYWSSILNYLEKEYV